MHNGQCVHFNGIQNKLCKRGVAYGNWEGSLPCIKFIEKNAKGGTYFKPGEKPVERKPYPGADTARPCPFYEEPSEADIDADRKETDVWMQKTLAAIRVANQWRVRPKPPADREAVVECPVCRGKLHLSQSAYNGHVHGTCETKDCVRWME